MSKKKSASRREHLRLQKLERAAEKALKEKASKPEPAK
jgi:hypothetical protein